MNPVQPEKQQQVSGQIKHQDSSSSITSTATNSSETSEASDPLLSNTRYFLLPNFIPIPRIASVVHVENLLTFSENAKQIMAVVFYVGLIMGLVASPVLISIACIYEPSIIPFFLLYFVFYLYDIQSPFKGGWSSQTFRRRFRSLPVWDYFRSYFPAKLIFHGTLDPKKNYILGYHPHGVYCLGAFANVLFNGSFQDAHPDIHIRGATLPINFYIPFWRDFILGMGSISCGRSDIMKVLSPEKTGTLMFLAVGGGEEFTFMSKGAMDLIVKKRKGFIRIALITGASLLPTIGFGENDVYERLDHPALDPLHKIAYLAAKMAAPLFKGRLLTPLPFRHPLVTVIADPIDVQQNSNPTSQEIDALHKKYMHALQSLYDQYKDQYHAYRTRDLQFVA